MTNVQTINFHGNEYATVPQRLKAFREANPRASITTKPEFMADGTIVFSATIIQDKGSATSAEATGHSYGKNAEVKAFEKLETVATGRALALLGYLNNGQIATTEEMEEFETYQMDRIIEAIGVAEKREEFAEILNKLSPEQKREVTPLIQKRIEEIKDGKAN